MGGAHTATTVPAPRLGTGPHLLCPSPDNPLHVESDSLEPSAEKRGGPETKKKKKDFPSSPPGSIPGFRFDPWSGN